MREQVNYLDYNQVLHIKRILIQLISYIIKDTDIGYYYSFSSISNLINNRLKQIYITDNKLPLLIELKEDTLILDQSFYENGYEQKLINSLQSQFLMIRSRQISLNLLANKTLDSCLKNSISLYFSSTNGTELKEFYNRSCDTSLPFFDLTLNIIRQLKLIVSDDLLAHTICYGDQKLSDYLNKVSGKKSILKQIKGYLFRINTIQKKINKANMRYLENENFYYRILAKINSYQNQNASDIKVELFYNALDLITKKQITSFMHFYNLYINDEQIESFYTCQDLINKIKKVLYSLKEEIKALLSMLDCEYIKASDFIIHNLILKYIKNNQIENNKEILKAFDYKILEQYSYLENSKEFKKLKKKMNS